MHIAVVRSNITVIDSQTFCKTAPLILSQLTLNFVSEGNCWTMVTEVHVNHKCIAVLVHTTNLMHIALFPAAWVGFPGTSCFVTDGKCLTIP
jgi:hypothetical protein